MGMKEKYSTRSAREEGMEAIIKAETDYADAIPFEAAFEAMSHAILVTDPFGAIVTVNEAFERITGWRRDEIVGRNPRILQSGRQGPKFYEQFWAALSKHGHWRGEIWNKRRNGEEYPEQLTVNAIYDPSGRVTHYVSIFNDITERKALEQQLSHMAFHDVVTELPNRAYFLDRLNLAIESGQRKDDRFAVFLIDLDGFKAVNDTLGHDMGDEVLNGVGVRLNDTIRANDVAARLGGDEFGMLLFGDCREDEATILAQRVVDTVLQPFSINGKTATVGASVGVSLYPRHGNTAEGLMKCADTAMYVAKRGGKGRFVLFRDKAA